MSETFKDFCLLSLFHITVDILLGCAKYLYHLYFNPTVFPVSNNISWFYSFFSVCLMMYAIIFKRTIHSLQTLGLVWGLRYKLSIGQIYFFLLVSFSFSCCLLILTVQERKEEAIQFFVSITCIILITPPFYTWQYHSFQLLSSKGVLAIPLIIFIASF